MKNIENELRALRGGSWSGASSNCRASGRCWFAPGYRSDNLGFRVALHRRNR